MNNLLELLRLAELGYRILFMGYKAKCPLKGFTYDMATSNSDEIKYYYKKFPKANFAILTGDLVVIDVDKLKDGSDNPFPFNEENQKDLNNAGAITKTGKNGRHYYFKNASNWNSKADFFGIHGVDVRGARGVIIIPPSQHKNGNNYEWIKKLEVPVNELPEPPKWLVNMKIVHNKQINIARKQSKKHYNGSNIISDVANALSVLDVLDYFGIPHYGIDKYIQCPVHNGGDRNFVIYDNGKAWYCHSHNCGEGFPRDGLTLLCQIMYRKGYPKLPKPEKAKILRIASDILKNTCK